MKRNNWLNFGWIIDTSAKRILTVFKLLLTQIFIHGIFGYITDAIKSFSGEGKIRNITFFITSFFLNPSYIRYMLRSMVLDLWQWQLRCRQRRRVVRHNITLLQSGPERFVLWLLPYRWGGHVSCTGLDARWRESSYRNLVRQHQLRFLK